MRTASTRVIVDMIMPHGWHYLQMFNNAPVKIQGGTYEELLNNVQEYRSNNGLPIGNVQGDVDQFICLTYPRQCHGTREAQTSVKVQVPTQQQVRFVDKLTQWALSVMRDSTMEYVVLSVAEDRGRVCLKCKHNMEWQTGSCGRCNSDANRLFLLTRKGKDVSFGSKLLGCKLHNHENRSAIWISKKQQRSAQAPSECWV